MHRHNRRVNSLGGALRRTCRRERAPFPRGPLDQVPAASPSRPVHFVYRHFAVGLDRLLWLRSHAFTSDGDDTLPLASELHLSFR